jgi:hypothetical protein
MMLFIKTLSGLSLTVLAVALVVAQGKVNFSGTWVLDKSKSDVSALLGTEEQTEKLQEASLTMVVEQEGTTLKVTRTLTSEGKERKETHTYKTDGTETTNTGWRGESVITKASWDGDKLVVVSTRTMKVLLKEIAVQSNGVWSLSPDGKTLRIDAQIHSPRKDQRLKAVFNKR